MRNCSRPLVSSLTSAAPRKVPSTDTRPPDSSVPPSTGPRKAGSSQSCPRSRGVDGSAHTVRANSIITTTPARTPDTMSHSPNARAMPTPERFDAGARAHAATIPRANSHGRKDGDGADREVQASRHDHHHHRKADHDVDRRNAAEREQVERRTNPGRAQRKSGPETEDQRDQPEFVAEQPGCERGT